MAAREMNDRDAADSRFYGISRALVANAVMQWIAAELQRPSRESTRNVEQGRCDRFGNPVETEFDGIGRKEFWEHGHQETDWSRSLGIKRLLDFLLFRPATVRNGGGSY